ncbi:hypothetical protein A2230_09450 [candidate division WOR-1 bacterium RIFOXYA2_FULL_36_21]|uniref:DUF3084 domain-containing protein n=1 Tax=candidate division WOR-1 bacterium RIFOXYB2_FULL_36_35 TaxID=1802578 RepID=A0A1F4S3V0_UNCSA|nr:MAG: hypothetical protein A2230_09450 [candidate division WOR-1 bacterium RIFOXYA2_FULL_36_21]OGC15080.1 MAG: hypothetical protein A2290_09270 [candidate division WOR-1 bacterium RIFOXYB2_FULL_36_35]OGC16461.1 MAG: hypothetical protein A2282_03375 [candidate division WOR-1 bacterium RIFOXYA12_FULL_36_13]
MNYSFAFRIIFILVVLSGIIAFVGNRIGRFFGKKRLSLFNLRPRHTATIFTVLSGILIMCLTFTTLIFLSKDVRTTLFGLEELRLLIKKNKDELAVTKKELDKQKNDLVVVRNNLDSVERQKEELEKEKLHLQRLRDKLRMEIDKQKMGTVIFGAGEIISIELIKADVDLNQAQVLIRGILKSLDKDVKQYLIPNVDVDKSDFDAAVSFLTNSRGDVVLRIKSMENVTIGSDLLVKIEVFSNELIYKKDEELINLIFSGDEPQKEIEEKLKDLLSTARFSATRKGVLPDVSGSFGSLSYSEIFDAVKEIKAEKRAVKVKILAKNDIYTIGPLNIRFKVEQ